MFRSAVVLMLGSDLFTLGLGWNIGDGEGGNSLRLPDVKAGPVFWQRATYCTSLYLCTEATNYRKLPYPVYDHAIGKK